MTNKFAALMALFLFLMTDFIANAQTFEGQIVDTKGGPVPNATLYIRETAHGIMADDNGRFQVKLPEGNYSCEVSSLGYERKMLNINISADGLKLNIELTEKTYSLKEVIVTQNKEDPAYRVMRNVIARAPYYYRQVKSYESSLYVKGSFKIEHLPWLLRKAAGKDMEKLIGQLLLYESQSEIKYTEPDRYEQRTMAVKSTIPPEFKVTNDMTASALLNNIYHPNAFGGLFATGSFSLYKFKMEDLYSENGHTVWKIRVIPRKKNGTLVSGTIYIIEDVWAVQIADLTRQESGLTTGFKMYYNEVKPDVWLPVSYDFNIEADVIGVRGNGKFFSSVKYKSLETNSYTAPNKANKPNKANELDSTQTQTAKKTSGDEKQKNKVMKQLEELYAKENLTTRDAYKMAKLMDKVVESEAVKQQKRSLEIPSRDSIIITTRDSLAFKRDSTFWSHTRTVPLGIDELRSYIKRDSLNLKKDSIRRADSLERRSHPVAKRIANILLGETVKIDSSKLTFRYDGILGCIQGFNFVDGFSLGQSFDLRLKIGEHNLLAISPAISYAIARKALIHNLNCSLEYAPMNFGKLNFSL
ncbi:MAG: DUF5686 and carboxypeptidase regulatory-like domain-containing protein, partial [Tannerella sp.]|nr:DUF5686 and carboxypeptidase regulatory-like domain-containing protein [Tannerella sp.]